MVHPGPWPIDLSVSHFIQAFQPAWLTVIVKIISFITAPEFYCSLGLVAVVWLWRRQHRRRAYFISGLLLGNAFIPLLKWIFQRPRPSPSLVHVYQHVGLSSFPSGHAIGIVILIAVLYVLNRHTVRRHFLSHMVMGVIVVACVGYSRIFLGVHWISDVFAGYVFGLLWVGTVFWIGKKYI
ncbi:MAG: phosphatase PAP2 family protein [Patescibacteria group bacterium]